MDRELCPAKPPPPPPVAIEAPSSPKFTKAKGKDSDPSTPLEVLPRRPDALGQQSGILLRPCCLRVHSKAILFPLTRMRKWQDLRMEKANKKGSASNGCPSRRHQLDGRFAEFGEERLPRNPPSRAGRQPAAAAASGSRRAMQQLGNVIVIED